jgi:2'-5' RNA ligase
MAQFAIVAFPETDATSAIEEVRARFDPLASTIGAHVTLVFPFATDLTTSNLRQHIEDVVAATPPFDIELSDVSMEEGGYVFLNVSVGRERIAALHDGLYSGRLAEHLSRGHRYQPHITVGRLRDADRLATAAREARAQLGAPRLAQIRAVALYRIDAPTAGAVEFSVALGSDLSRRASR